MWAIIGGSGFEKFDGFKTLEHLDGETPFGRVSSGMKRVRIGEQECLFVSRHGEFHERLPSEVNYRANIYNLKKHGAKAILSFSAVGSLRKEYAPGDLVVPAQYIDRTKGLRPSTFLGDGVVGHVSLAKPVCGVSLEGLKKMSQGFDFKCHFDQTYICIEGPYFSTQAESNNYRSMGADIIGMTHFPEFALAREAGLHYVPCCFITDYDCWDESRAHVTLEEVIEVMRDNNSKAFKVAEEILSQGNQIYNRCEACSNGGLKTGLMTPRDMITKDKMKWLEVLL